MADEEGQAEPQGLQDLQLQDGILARGGKTRNVHLGSCKKMDATEARRKAREMKAEALGYIGAKRRCS